MPSPRRVNRNANFQTTQYINDNDCPYHFTRQYSLASGGVRAEGELPARAREATLGCPALRLYFNCTVIVQFVLWIKPQFHPNGAPRFIPHSFSILNSDSLRAAFGGCSLDAHCGGCLHSPSLLPPIFSLCSCKFCRNRVK